MASPPVQPIRSSRCGIASVTAMELFTGTISLESLGRAARPGVGRENHRLGLDPGPGAQQLCRLAGNDLADATTLVDFHAEGQRHAAHALHQQGWLHGGIAALEDPGEMHRRTGPACHFAGVEAFEGTDAEPFAGGEGIVPGVEVVRRGGGPQPALLLEVRIDVMPRAELPEFLGRPLRAFAKEARLRLAAEAQQGADLRPPGHHETTVPAGSAAAADVLLQQQDPCVRLQLLEGDGGPEPDETAADYRHVRRVGADEGGAGGVGQVGRAHPVAGGQGGVSVSFMARVRGR